MAQYKIKDIQQRISEALRQLKNGDRPIITSNGQAVAAIISITDLERLNDMDNLDLRNITLQVTPHIDPERIADAVLVAYDQDPLAALEALRKDIDKRNAAMGIILKRLAMEE